MGQKIVHLTGALADQMGKNLALLLASQIGAGRGSRQVELRRIARMLRHGQFIGTGNSAGLMAKLRAIRRFRQRP